MCLRYKVYIKPMVQPCFKIETTIIGLWLRRNRIEEFILTSHIREGSLKGAIIRLGLINYVIVSTNEKAC